MDEHNDLELVKDLDQIVEHIVMVKQQQHYMVEQFVDLAYGRPFRVVDNHLPRIMVVLVMIEEVQDNDSSAKIH